MSSVLTPRSYIDQRNSYAVADASADAGITQITVTPERNTTKEFFGENGPSFRDVLDAINPLNHIPIVSGLLEKATGHTPSIASKLAGGALFGPIGFAASLVDVIFQQQTGKGAADSMIAALSSDRPATTQTANADKPSTEQLAANESAGAAAPQQYASLDLPTTPTAGQRAAAQAEGGAIENAPDTADGNQKNQAILSLYGASIPSANRAYQNAQFRPYLRAANTNAIL